MQVNNTFRWFLLLLFISTSIFVHAANVEYLVFNVNGTPVTIVLAEHPVITYTDNSLHVRTEKMTIDISVADIKEAAFQSTTGISHLSVSHPSIEAGRLLFSQLPVGSKVEVFSTDGQQVESVIVGSDQQAVVNIYRLASGVYIVKTATQSIKITNK